MNRFRKNKVVLGLGLCILCATLWISDVQCAPFVYAMQKGDMVVYKVDSNGVIEYHKYNITAIVESATNFTVNFTQYIASDPAQFSTASNANYTYVLTNNLTHDILFEPTLVSITLQNDTDLTGYEESLDSVVRHLIDQAQPGMTIDSVDVFHPEGPSSIRIIARSYGLKILDITCLYATTGLLLYTTINMGDSFASIEIVPEQTTMVGAEEYDPEAMEETDEPPEYPLTQGQVYWILFGGLGAIIAYIVFRKKD